MGTTVSNLQILGASPEDVRAALPHALVGQWSERFVTACPGELWIDMENKGKSLSRKLQCTVLSVSMIKDGTLRLLIFQDGKTPTCHIALPATGTEIAGNPKLFCTALGLPEELAPKLKRLFTDCIVQEEKLAVLQSLLGAPLFLRYSDEEERLLPEGPVKADSGPLEEWLSEHSVPSKIKNQCKAELLQEITDRHPDYGSGILIFRPGVREGDGHTGWYSVDRAGDILGYAERGGEWARPLPDGRMELVALEDQSIEAEFGNCHFTSLGDRLIMMVSRLGPDPSGFPGAKRPVQTVVVRDTAGIIPCPFPLTWEGEPIASGVMPLADGGFLIKIAALEDGSRPPVEIREEFLACYGPDMALRWTLPGIDHIYQITEQGIYGTDSGEEHLLVLRPDGTVIWKYPLPKSPYGTAIHILGGKFYVETGEYQKDHLLYRLTPDLRLEGEVRVPYLSDLALSPDSTLLYAAGFQSGLRVIDSESLHILHDLPQRGSFHSPVVDGQNRLWVANSGCFECYTPSLELISRHRLKGSVYRTYRNDAGQACALTFQENKYILRVYRFV